jgi:hypothetical protein
MKKILIILSFLFLLPACAQHGHRGGNHWGGGGHHYNGNGYYRGGGYNWVAPLVIGGAVGYAITRPPVVMQQPLYTQPMIVDSTLVYIDGVAYRKEIVNINGVNQEVLIRQ